MSSRRGCGSLLGEMLEESGVLNFFMFTSATEVR